MHLVGFIIRIYHDARSAEGQILQQSYPNHRTPTTAEKDDMSVTATREQLNQTDRTVAVDVIKHLGHRPPFLVILDKRPANS